MNNLSARVVIGDSRNLMELGNESIALAVTSPPYWHIKDYGTDGQIGFNQTLHDYLRSLFSVWAETYRVLRPGSRLCVNIGDQFLRSAQYGRYKVAPIHAEIISQCEQIGFDYMGSIIWQKKTTMNTTGGANVMGSFPYPRNGILEIDYEFILIFKKTGEYKVTPEIKERSRLSKEEWKEYFSGHWYFPGEKQSGHEAMFPLVLPRRLIRMYSFVDDLVLDPFLGSGTTMRAAVENGRSCVGYEINRDFIPMITEKMDSGTLHSGSHVRIEIEERAIRSAVGLAAQTGYVPGIQDIEPIVSPVNIRSNRERLYKVTGIQDSGNLELDNGSVISFLGITITDEKRLCEYLNRFLRGKQVFLRFQDAMEQPGKSYPAYVYLKNRIFINREIVRLKLGKADGSSASSKLLSGHKRVQ